MLYGTFAATHFLARLMISARVVSGTRAPAGGTALRPAGPYSGARSPWGVPGSSPAGTPGRSGAWAAAGSAAAGLAPSAAEAAVATIRVRWAAGWAKTRPDGECGRTRRQCRQPGQSQSPSGSNSSNTGASMRFPSHSC